MSRERSRFEDNVDTFGLSIAEELERTFAGAVGPTRPRRARRRTAAIVRR